MAKKVFVSYRHQQAEWVRTTLYPVLSAGGAQVVIDYKEFAAGLAVRQQMKAAQDKADIHLLLLTPDYLQSDYCVEEMQRAFALDPDFSKGLVLPVLLERCDLPPEIQQHQPLYVDLTGNRQQDTEAWKLLMERCGANLWAPVPYWLNAFSQTLNALRDRKSVNLVVIGHPKWRELLSQLKLALPELGMVDLESGRTTTRRGLVGEILRELAGYGGKLPPGQDLAEMERVLESKPPSLLALRHFDKASERNYTNDLYSSLRYLITEKRKLTLLIQSRAPFGSILPANHPLSYLTPESVVLDGRL